MRRAPWFGLALTLSLSTPVLSAEKPPQEYRRVVFLGDSITYAGQYVEFVEAALRLKNPGMTTEFLDIGLPSETVSGLSEPGHAGGAFPRPTLHERLDRVLAKAKPDLVVACYGMNDGIYYPLGEDRFAAYRKGIELLRSKAKAAGADILHLTPPVFDAEPIKARTLPAGLDEYKQPYVGYDEVLARYAAWLMERKADGWAVIDIHTPIRKALDAGRMKDPAFRLAGDGVHMDANGHWLIARELLNHWGVPVDVGMTADAYFASKPHGKEVLDLVQKRQRLLKDAWLNDTGHKRPGMARGVGMEKAGSEAAAIESQLRSMLK